MADDVWILGIHMTKFGKHPDLDAVGHHHAEIVDPDLRQRRLAGARGADDPAPEAP